MGTLRDEVYEKLDYLSQLTEIVVSPQNEVLGRLPDKLELDFTQVKKFKQRTWRYGVAYEITVYNILASMLNASEHKFIDDIISHFELQVSEDFEIDFVEETMFGSLCLIKTEAQIEEKKLLEIAVKRAQHAVDHYSWPSKQVRDRLVTILNTLEPNRGTTWAQKVSGGIGYAGVAEIRATIADLILENKWRIRDARTIEKVGEWINLYMCGQEIGLMNLLKLKIMINKDLPIYSVDEVKKNANGQ